MRIPLRHRLLALAIGGGLSACGGDLTLPQDRSPAALEAVSGDGQEGTVGSRLNDPLVVEVTDASSQPVAGVAVVFQFADEVPEAEVDPTEAVTDSNGRAEAQVRLGANTGTQRVEAQVAETGASELVATFDLTAVAPEKGKKGGKGRRGGGSDDDDDDDDDEDEDD